MIFFILSTFLKTISTCELVVDDTMDGKDNMEKKTTKVAEKTDVSFRLEFFQLDVTCCGDCG